MLTTQALIDAALARGLRERLPGEWWRDAIACPRCYKTGTHYYSPEENVNICNACLFESVPPWCTVEVYIGPDLTAPANLYELLRFADAISDFDVDIMADCENGPEHFSATLYTDADKETGESKIHKGYGPDRSTAVLAACAKALGLEGAG